MIVAVLAATGRSVISARQWFLTTAAETGAALIMLGRALAYTRLIGRSLPQLRRQLDEAGFGSIVVLSLIAGLTGMIVAVQTGSALEQFGVVDTLGAIVGATFTREMGPLWAAVIVLARVGASMAAEIGTMAVNEEVDALRAMSIDPVRYLVMPRIISLMVIMVLLTSIADFVGMAGGAMVAKQMYGVPVHTFMDSAQGLLRGLDIWAGLFKSLVFGVIIGTIACDRGLNTTNGAEGVGRSTTATVVRALVFMLVINYVLSTVTEKVLRPWLT